MKQHHINYRTLSFVALTAFVILLVLFTSETINNWIFRMVGVQANSIYLHLNENNHLNTLLFISVVILMIVCSIKSATNYYRKWKSLGAVIINDILLATSMNHWTWSTSVFGTNWGLVLIFVFTIPYLLSTLLPYKIKNQVAKCMKASEDLIENIYNKCLKIIKKKYKQPDISKESVGFCIDDIDEQTNDEHIRQPYADLIVKKALNTKQKEAFAIGISGGWGAGKTLFLKRIENSIIKAQKDDGNVFLYKFCPWESTDSKQIITDFFNGLGRMLEPHYSAIKKPIIKYSELLTAVSAPDWVVSMSKLFDNKQQQTIKQQKGKITECLNKLGRKIFVLIDDIDRLGAQEIFETLKLIRNTADFSQIIYIVTYDKQYITEQLSKADLESSYLYIEKIFPLEIKLQRPEPHYQARCLDEIIPEMTNNSNLKRAITYIINSNENIINQVLVSYRQVKRFARQFVLDFETVQSILQNDIENKSTEINTEDFFLLELLYYHDSELYNTLRDKPTSILMVVVDEKLHIKRFTLRPGIDGTRKTSIDDVDDEGNYTGKQLGNESLIILKKLFNPKRNYKNITQLAFTESYHKYFSFGLSFDQLAISEVHSLIAGQNNIDSQVEKWCSDRKHNSLLRIVMSYTPTTDSYNCKRYISTVLSMVAHFPSIDSQIIDKLFPWTLRSNHFSEKLFEELQSYTISLFQEHIQSANHGQEYELYAMSLARLCEFEANIFERTGDEGHTLVGSYNNAQSLLVENVSRFLSTNKCTADNIFDRKDVLCNIIIASALNRETGAGNIYQSAIFNFLLEYFSKHKGHNKHSAEMFFEADISGSPSEDELNDRQAAKDRTLYMMFTNRDNYLKFINECFE